MESKVVIKVVSRPDDHFGRAMRVAQFEHGEELYLGPTRPLCFTPEYGAVLTNVMFMTLFFLTNLFLFLTLVPFASIELVICSVISILSFIAQFPADGIIARINKSFEFLYACLHGMFACISIQVNQPWIRMRCRPSYPEPDEMTVDCSRGTAEEKQKARIMLAEMQAASRVNWWNRFRYVLSAFGEPSRDRFIAGKCLVMANHLSNADGYVARGMVWPTPAKILFKESLGRIPLLGWNFRITRDIAIPSTMTYKNTEEGEGSRVEEKERAGVRQRIYQSINNKQPIFLFPEGTRSTVRRMLPFRNGMFQTALDTETPIWTMALFRTDEVLDTGAFCLDRGGEIDVLYSTKLIFPYGHDIESLKEAVKEEMLSMLNKHCPTFDAELHRPLVDLDELKKIRAVMKTQVGKR